MSNDRSPHPARKQFPFYRSFMDALDVCPKEHRLELYEAITHYSFCGTEPQFDDPFCIFGWSIIKPLLDAAKSHYEAGLKGGCPRGQRNNPSGKNQWSNSDELNQMDNQNSDELNQMDNMSLSKKEERRKKKKEDNIIEPANAGQHKEPNSEQQRFLDELRADFPSVMKMQQPLTYDQCVMLREAYTADEIRSVLAQMENSRSLRTKYKSAYLTASNWLKRNTTNGK